MSFGPRHPQTRGGSRSADMGHALARLWMHGCSAFPERHPAWTHWVTRSGCCTPPPSCLIPRGADPGCASEDPATELPAPPLTTAACSSTSPCLLPALCPFGPISNPPSPKDTCDPTPPQGPAGASYPVEERTRASPSGTDSGLQRRPEKWRTRWPSAVPVNSL